MQLKLLKCSAKTTNFIRLDSVFLILYSTIIPNDFDRTSDGIG